MKKKPPVGKHIMNVGVAALARECGVSEATVSRKMKRGKTADQIRREAAARKGLKPPNTNGPGRPAKPSEYDMVIEARSRYDALEEAKLRRAKALAERQELENMLRRGELMPVSYARLWGVKFLIAARDELLRGPGELGDAVAAESDPIKCTAMLRAWTERALAKFVLLEHLWKGDFEAEEVA